MHPLLRYTLDLFDVASQPVASAPGPAKAPDRPRRQKSKPFRPVAPIDSAQTAIDSIVNSHFTHPKANRAWRLGDATVAYVFARAKRRTIGFVVGPDGLAVRAPRWTPQQEVDAALQEKAAWILRKLQETRERHTRQHAARIIWRDGTLVPWMGGTLQVALDPGHHFAAQGAQLKAAQGESLPSLAVALPHHAEPAQIRDAVQAWQMRQAQALFKLRLDHFAPLLGVHWRKLSLSNAATRWGSAKSDGSIRLNWRLVHFSPAVIDYVVVHELAHLRVMNHSPRFWDTVETVLPEYASLRTQLKDDAHPKW